MLLRSIALGRKWLGEILDGATPDALAARDGCTRRHVETTIPLAFLAPTSYRRRSTRGMSTRRIADPDLIWSRQWNALGVRR